MYLEFDIFITFISQKNYNKEAQIFIKTIQL